MYATNVRNLKRNPSEALRHAELEPVLILKGNQPNALILNLKSSLGDMGEQLKPALAASLFKDRVLSLVSAQPNHLFFRSKNIHPCHFERG